MIKLPKVTKYLVIGGVSLIVLIILASSFFEKVYPYPTQIKYGVSFSPRYAKYLQLDWQKTYLYILDELQVRNLRIPSYWDIVEPEPGRDDFSTVDYMLDEAAIRGVKVILVLGQRQPRWPECHIPDWVKKLSVKDRQGKTLQFITKVLERYKNNPAIWAWQVENEPLLSSFGEGCDPPDKNFLKAEVELVRKLNGKPIIVTDSGELGFWITSMQLSDIFGTTLYRQIYDAVLGYTTYPLLPYLYNLKSSLVRNVFAKNNQKTIILELQAEPWSPTNDLVGTPIQRQVLLLPVDQFQDNVNFAKQTGFDEIYLWGVEWWYFMETQGYPQYLEFAKTLFTKP